MTKLGILGRERMLINKLTRTLHRETQRHHNYGSIKETDRGCAFEVQMLEGDEKTGCIARVTVELDRVEP